MIGLQDSREERDFDTVLMDDLRPAGDGKHCFYCTGLLGGPHDPTCVIRWGAGHYFVTLRNNETGEERRYREDSIWNDTQSFLWDGGNFSCDCNRQMMFQRAAGEEPDWNSQCGDGKYSVEAITAPDGTAIEWGR